MRKHFEEMMEIVDRLQEKVRQFIEISPNLSFQESYAELSKCNEFTDKIDKKLKEMVRPATDSNIYCTDLAANLMCRYVSLIYEKTVLSDYNSKLKKEFFKASKLKKKKHENKFSNHNM